MMALQRLNPEAFIGGNVNQLKAGYVLKVPDREQIEAMTQAQARAEFRRQTQAWRGEPAPAATSTAAAEPSASQGRLQLLAPDGSEAATDDAAVQQAGDAESRSGQPVSGSAAGTAEGTSEQNEAMRQKIDQLQQQVQDLERLAQLKDDQLAALQAQLQALGGDEAGVQAPAEMPADAESAPGEMAAEEAAPESMSADAPMASTEAMPEPTQAADSRFGMPATATRAMPGQPSNPYVVSGYDPVDLASLPSEAEVAAPSAEAAAGGDEAALTIGEQITAWWQKTVAMFRDNPLYLGIAVAVLLVLLLAAMAVRQRRRAAAGFGESILQPSPEPQSERATAAVAAGGGAAAAAAAASEPEPAQHSEQQESSYLSDFSISGMDSAIESEVSEADPLTEADVFLAYGRYQPAENMIKEAIESEPERLDLKIKLLEIYYAARNGEAFEREAQVVHGLMEDHSDPAWQKVVEMGRDLRPDSPLFSDTGDVAEAASEQFAEEEDFGLNETDFEIEQEQAAKPAADDNLIDFDLGELEQAQTGSVSRYETAAATGTDDTVEHGDSRQELAGELADELSALSGSLNAEAESPAAQQGEVADFDLGDLDLEPEAQAQVERAYLGDLDDLESAPDEEEEVMDGGVLSDGDEVGTKLDLARAYIDMGDPDGARSILDEVLEEGSEDQKNEAEGLMAQIS